MILRLSIALLCLLLSAPAMAQPLSADDRNAVLKAAADLLATRYVFPDKGRALAAQLRADARADRFAGVTDPVTFAKQVTQRLRALSGDGHLGLDYSEKAVAEDAAEAEGSYNATEMERWYGAHINHGFEQIARLEGNIGYLDLRVFAPPAMAGDVAAAAMTVLAQSDAVIVDLRKNGGGDGALGLLIAAYLFDGAPRPMSGTYNRPMDKLTPSLTPAWVPGRRIGPNKPVYVLTSKRTFSAAEAFAYDLQALKRVTVVGEPTGGGAHPFEYRRVHPHFMLSLAEGRSVNPITGSNWQGTGVTPDVRVPAEDALQKALELAKAAVLESKQPTD
jgi:hypothetical protein